MMDFKYFCDYSIKDKVILDKLQEISRLYYQNLNSVGLTRLYKESFFQFYRSLSTGGNVRNAGRSGQIKKITANTYRSIIESIQNIVTKDTPIIKAFGKKSEKVDVANMVEDLINYYQIEKGLHSKMSEANQMSLLYSCSLLSFFGIIM